MKYAPPNLKIILNFNKKQKLWKKNLNEKVDKEKGQWIFDKNKQKYFKKIKNCQKNTKIKKKAHFFGAGGGGLRHKNQLGENQKFLRGED